MAKLAGITPRAVRWYETAGLLPTASRTRSGYRSYPPQDVELLRFIVRLRGIGLGIREIREIVELRARGVPPPERVMAVLETELSQVERSMVVLQQRRDLLAGVLHHARSLAADGNAVRLCRIIGF
jgi:MerR family transcriptional regulator, copper efflux regulator